MDLTTTQAHAHTCTHCQSGLTALKLAQSEGHQDICDTLLQYTQQGPKVIHSEPVKSERRQEEDIMAAAELVEVCIYVYVDDNRQGIQYMLTCQLPSYPGTKNE